MPDLEPDWTPTHEEIANLPAFPANGVCPCGETAWHIVEMGYWRFTASTFEDGVLIGHTNGWSDMSEGGTAEWAECRNDACPLQHQLPDEVEYV